MALENAEQLPSLLLKTPLHGIHLSLGGKMVPFAGYDMPVQYDGMGVLKEHLHTRTAAGLFDVSHMGQALLTAPEGTDPAALLETLTPGDLQGLAPGQIRYTLLLNDHGGIIDDLMVTRFDAHTLFLVVNAACKEKDFHHIREKLASTEAKLHELPDRALVALQGPKAEYALAALLPDAAPMTFMTAIRTMWYGHDVYVSRSGYTGEDGFEISLPEQAAVPFAGKLLEIPEVRAIGLGARDSLRLEAGLCLYGHDISDDTTPVEANLKWTVPKRRREEANFPGHAEILRQFREGPARLRVGIRPEGRAPLREGTPLMAEDGRSIGVITSGGFGPSVDGPVAMGYVDAGFAATGTKITAELRGQKRPCVVATLPFTPHNYKKA